MLEALDIPDIRKRVAPISIDRYHRMIDLGVFDGWNVELLNGVLVEKMSRSELHVFLVDLLFELLREHCVNSGLWVRKEDPITIGNSEPEPDVSVVEGTHAEFRRVKPVTARFVVEVAISSLGIDRAKSSDYARADVPEYWIIRPEEALIEVFRRPSNGDYAEVTEISADETLQSSVLPGFSFNLAAALRE